MFNPKQKKTDLSAYKDHSFISKQARIQGDIHFHGRFMLKAALRGKLLRRMAACTSTVKLSAILMSPMP